MRDASCAVQLGRQRFLHLLDHSLKGGRIVNCHVRQHLAIQFNVRLVKTVHKGAISQPALANGGVDTDDPKFTELPFADAAIAKGKLSSSKK